MSTTVVHSSVRMSHARAAALLLVCALAANAAPPRPAENTNKCDKEEKMVSQEKTIVVRRVPIAYFYPFSLWPVPKYPPRGDREDSDEIYHYRRNVHMRPNKR